MAINQKHEEEFIELTELLKDVPTNIPVLLSHVGATQDLYHFMMPSTNGITRENDSLSLPACYSITKISSVHCGGDTEIGMPKYLPAIVKRNSSITIGENATKILQSYINERVRLTKTITKPNSYHVSDSNNYQDRVPILKPE